MAIAPPRPPSQNESDALVREARARQQQRRIVIASLVALVTGAAVGIYATLVPSGRSPAPSRGSASVASSSSPCGIRVVGTRILDRSGATTYRDPAKVAMNHQTRCSGSTAWVVFVNGVGMMHEEYVGVRSGDGGRTWRLVFALGVHFAPRNRR